LEDCDELTQGNDRSNFSLRCAKSGDENDFLHDSKSDILRLIGVASHDLIAEQHGEDIYQVSFQFQWEFLLL